MWVLCLFKILPKKRGGGVLMGGWMEDALLRGAVIIPTDEEGRGVFIWWQMFIRVWALI